MSLVVLSYLFLSLRALPNNAVRLLRAPCVALAMTEGGRHYEERKRRSNPSVHAFTVKACNEIASDDFFTLAMTEGIATQSFGLLAMKEREFVWSPYCLVPPRQLRILTIEIL